MCSTLPDGDLDGLTDGELLEHIGSLVAEQNRVAARLARAVRAAECRQAAERDGLRSMRSWLRTHTRLSERTAKQVVDTGRALPSLPAAAAAFTAGELTAEQVAVLAPITAPERVTRAAEAGVDLAAVEADLVELARSAPHRRLQEAVHFYTSHLDPDGAEPDPTEARSFTMSRLLDGVWHGTFVLDSVGGEKVATALESIAAASRCAGDLRTAAQARGDALVQLCDLALASGQLPVLRTVKPHVIVTIPMTDLTDPATGPGAARTGLDAQLSAAKARWLACDAGITRIVLGPDGLPLDVGRDHRVVPAHIRKAVVERDRTCVFTGCEAPHWWCDVHHLVEWINGGDTSLDNSGLLCERHHTKIHHGYRVERDDGAPPGRRWRTWRPDGTEIVLRAPLVAAERVQPGTVSYRSTSSRPSARSDQKGTRPGRAEERRRVGRANSRRR